ncbi:MAG: hypothetical protein QOE84_2463 [Actinomycetota bacterium]|jgi:hypothetical protein|nr:hypothetical protein [Actinomycetota bacterium]
MDLWELGVREQVRDTLARYTHAGDSGRIDELARCFVPDGVLEVKGLPPARGRDAILALLSPSAGADGDGAVLAHRFVRHNLSSIRIVAVEPDRVETAAYFLVATADGPDHWGRYRDVLVPFHGDWLFAHRRVTVDAKAPGSYLTG